MGLYTFYSLSAIFLKVENGRFSVGHDGVPQERGAIISSHITWDTHARPVVRGS